MQMIRRVLQRGPPDCVCHCHRTRLVQWEAVALRSRLLAALVESVADIAVLPTVSAHAVDAPLVTALMKGSLMQIASA